MTYPVNTILVPVLIDTEYLSIVKQAAELAKEHKATLHILLMPENLGRYPLLKSWLRRKDISSISEEKGTLLATWSRYFELIYGIEVKCGLNWGGIKKGVLKYASNIQADLIILKYQTIKQRWLFFGKTATEYIIQNSRCQVMTIFSGTETVSEWKKIIIPVTSFIPETRVRTIIKIAKTFNLKIQLLAIAEIGEKTDASNFYFLTETLKLLKNAGNIQVECTCLQSGFNGGNNFLNYAKCHQGDVLMTNKLNSNPAVLYSTDSREEKNFISSSMFGSIQ